MKSLTTSALFNILLMALSVFAEETKTFELYKWMTYDQIRAGLHELADLFPQVIQLETAEEKLGIPSLVECRGDVKDEICVTDIVTLTDRNVAAEDKVQIYISGALHGNERIGPHVAYYFIQFMASNFGKDAYLTHMLQTREIIITPMTNAYGFSHNRREERTILRSNGRYRNYDPNRDFPYNQDPEMCLNTVTGRTVYKLMVQNLFVTSITFHGGVNVIGYPWGSNNHVMQ